MARLSVEARGPAASAARAAPRAELGAGAAGCPTSMWMTWPPEASIRAAAAITSITMKGGTSLRAEAANRRLAESVLSARPAVAEPFARPFARFLNVASGIDICYLGRRLFIQRPRLAAFSGLEGHILYPLRRQRLKIAQCCCAWQPASVCRN